MVELVVDNAHIAYDLSLIAPPTSTRPIADYVKPRTRRMI